MTTLNCQRCGYEWTIRDDKELPGQCANESCRSHYYDRPVGESPTNYRRTEGIPAVGPRGGHRTASQKESDRNWHDRRAKQAAVARAAKGAQ